MNTRICFDFYILVFIAAFYYILLLFCRCCYSSTGGLLPVGSHAVVEGLSIVLRSDDGSEAYENCCDAADLESGMIPAAMCTEFIDYRPACDATLFEELCKWCQ